MGSLPPTRWRQQKNQAELIPPSKRGTVCTPVLQHIPSRCWLQHAHEATSRHSQTDISRGTQAPLKLKQVAATNLRARAARAGNRPGKICGLVLPFYRPRPRARHPWEAVRYVRRPRQHRLRANARRQAGRGQQLTAAFASFRAERGKRLFISHFVPPISLSPCEPCNRMYSVTCITRCGCAPTSSPHQTRHVFPCGVAIIV